MKEEINLLPADVLRKRTRSIYAHRMHRLGWFLVLALILVNASFLAVYVSLKDSIKAIASEGIVRQTVDRVTIADEIARINKFVGLFEEKKEEYDPWLTLLKDVVDTKPSSTTIVSLAVKENEGKQSLSLNARSSSRSEVVSWQQSLEDLDWVEKVEAPLQNFATGPNAMFTFTLYKGDN